MVTWRMNSLRCKMQKTLIAKGDKLNYKLNYEKTSVPRLLRMPSRNVSRWITFCARNINGKSLSYRFEENFIILDISDEFCRLRDQHTISLLFYLKRNANEKQILANHALNWLQTGILCMCNRFVRGTFRYNFMRKCDDSSRVIVSL